MKSVLKSNELFESLKTKKKGEKNQVLSSVLNQNEILPVLMAFLSFIVQWVNYFA